MQQTTSTADTGRRSRVANEESFPEMHTERDHWRCAFKGKDDPTRPFQAGGAGAVVGDCVRTLLELHRGKRCVKSQIQL